MAERDGPSTWLSDRTGLTLLALASAVLAALIVLPYLQYVLLGVVLAYVLVPAQRRLEEYLPPGVAAMALVVVAALAILLPIVYLLAVALQEALQLVAAVQNGTLDLAVIEGRLEETGYAVDVVELYETYQEPIGTGVQGLATSAIEFVGGLPGILIGLTVTLFVLFALLRDRRRLLAWIRRVLPVREDLQNELFAELDQLMWASVVGNVAVAAVQAVLLGFGLAVLGVPAVAFLTVTTFVLTLLPLIGAFGVWVPVSLYLLAVGRPVAAVVLIGYGSFVSASDVYLRPALIGRTVAFNSATIVVGIFGGLVVFGAVGLFVGPVVLGGAKITLDVFARERAAAAEPEPEADAAPEDAAPPSDDATEAVDAETDAPRGRTAVEWDADPASDPVGETVADDGEFEWRNLEPEPDRDGGTSSETGRNPDASPETNRDADARTEPDADDAVTEPDAEDDADRSP